jgi:cobalt transporter subunit CbtA
LDFRTSHKRITRRTTRGTPADFLVTEFEVHTFRKLIIVALTAGTLSGLVWFGLQYLAVIPLIETAEKYEMPAAHDDDHGAAFKRNSLTAATTVLTAIGFAAALFGILSITGRRLDASRGALWGLAAFGCVAIAPALGLPPQPPGTAVADLTSRQFWWLGTVVATGIGVYLIAASGRRPLRILAGLLCLLLPHAIGAPASVGESLVPAWLVRQFEVASLAATGIFWLTLGTVGGFLGKDRL